MVFIQRFGSVANLNVHFHIVGLDGVYEEKSTGDLKFYNAAAPTAESMLALATDIAKRVNNVLLRKGYLGGVGTALSVRHEQLRTTTASRLRYVEKSSCSKTGIDFIPVVC